MKIIYISNSIIPSRIANSIHVMKMCQAFSKNGHEVILIAPNNKEQKEKNIENVYDFYNVDNCFKIKYLPSPKVKGRSLIYSYQIFKFLKKEKANMVYGRFIHGCFISSLLGFNTFYESHGPIWENNLIGKLLFNKMIKNANLKKIITISQALKDMYIKQYTTLENIELIVAHDGADEVNSLENKIVLKGKNKLNICYIGHLYPGRGIDVIIDLAKKILDIDFHIIGGNEKDIKYWRDKVQLHKLGYALD